MNITKHCQIRQQQRHISNRMINLTLLCGKEIKNTDKIALRKAEINDLYYALFDLIKLLENNH